MDPQVKVVAAVYQERKMQDRQWGGAEHDDTHNHDDWLNYIGYQMDRSRYGDDKRERLIKIAALAIAAVEAMDRKT